MAVAPAPGRRQVAAAVHTHTHPLSDSGRAPCLSWCCAAACPSHPCPDRPSCWSRWFSKLPLSNPTAARPLASFSVTYGRRCRVGHFICARDTINPRSAGGGACQRRRPCTSKTLERDAPAGYFVKFCDVCLGMRPPGAPHQLAPDGRRTRTRTARTRISRTSEAEKHARHGQAAAFARGDVP